MDTLLTAKEDAAPGAQLMPSSQLRSNGLRTANQKAVLHPARRVNDIEADLADQAIDDEWEKLAGTCCGPSMAVYCAAVPSPCGRFVGARQARCRTGNPSSPGASYFPFSPLSYYPNFRSAGGGGGGSGGVKDQDAAQRPDAASGMQYKPQPRGTWLSCLGLGFQPID